MRGSFAKIHGKTVLYMFELLLDGESFFLVCRVCTVSIHGYRYVVVFQIMCSTVQCSVVLNATGGFHYVWWSESSLNSEVGASTGTANHFISFNDFSFFS